MAIRERVRKLSLILGSAVIFGAVCYGASELYGRESYCERVEEEFLRIVDKNRDNNISLEEWIYVYRSLNINLDIRMKYGGIGVRGINPSKDFSCLNQEEFLAINGMHTLE